MHLMHTISLIDSRPRAKRLNADRIGVIASTLCAIHCAVTPFLLLLLPTFGKMWAHPATHWGMALVVVPIAIIMMTSGYRKHRRKWIVAIGSAGVALVILGAAVPYLENAFTAEPAEPAAPTPVAASSEGEADPGEVVHEEHCDSCCPSLTTNAEGDTKLKIPTASIVTTLGGVALIITHLGNLCTCASCRRRDCKDI
jgi:hypothetical protein